jgi:hypothetical protein
MVALSAPTARIGTIAGVVPIGRVAVIARIAGIVAFVPIGRVAVIARIAGIVAFVPIGRVAVTARIGTIAQGVRIAEMAPSGPTAVTARSVAAQGGERPVTATTSCGPVAGGRRAAIGTRATASTARMPRRHARAN